MPRPPPRAPLFPYTTLFRSNSHLRSEIELTCDRVAVLRNGKMAAFGSVEELTRKSATYKMVATPIDESLGVATILDRKSTRLNSSHGYISYAVVCLKKKKRT